MKKGTIGAAFFGIALVIGIICMFMCLVRIPNGYVGDIPEDVAEQWIIKAAIEDGSIVCSESHKDTEVEKAVSAGKAKVKETAKKKETTKKKEES